jgi:ElaB/YqjD/DUF883 family membrane-anchored ribosome-binding protein
MTTPLETIQKDINQLKQDAEALISAGRQGISDKTEGFSSQLASSKERGRELYRLVRKRGAECGESAEHEFQAHSLRYLAIVAGISALVGFVIASSYKSRCICK